MPIKLLELDTMLEDGVGKHYDSLSKDIKDYGEEHERILKARKEEFKQASFIERKLLWSESSYPYSRELAAKQNYHIDNGKIGIRTEQFFLPVSPSTEIEKVEIYSPARIPCCWEGVRKEIAEENGLMISDNKFYASVAYIRNIPSRKKSVKFVDSLIDIIIDVKNAKERLEAGIQKDFNSKLELTKI